MKNKIILSYFNISSVIQVQGHPPPSSMNSSWPGLWSKMPPSGGVGGGGQSGYGYQDYSEDMAAGYTGTGYTDAGYDAAYDDEYPAQKPYPHPGQCLDITSVESLKVASWLISITRYWIIHHQYYPFIDWDIWSDDCESRHLGPGIRGLQYGGDGRQYAAGGLPAGGGQWGYEDDGGYGYGDDEVEDLNARMAAMTAEQRKAAIEAAQRSQSSKRYQVNTLLWLVETNSYSSLIGWQEMERERKRRQLKTQGATEKTNFFQSTKLALMNSGLIPLKRGESRSVSQWYVMYHWCCLKSRGESVYFQLNLAELEITRLFSSSVKNIWFLRRRNYFAAIKCKM